MFLAGTAVPNARIKAVLLLSLFPTKHGYTACLHMYRSAHITHHIHSLHVRCQLSVIFHNLLQHLQQPVLLLCPTVQYQNQTEVAAHYITLQNMHISIRPQRT